MKVIETCPREIDFVLWGHCQNLLDDPRIYKIMKKQFFNAFIPVALSLIEY